MIYDASNLAHEVDRVCGKRRPKTSRYEHGLIGPPSVGIS